MSPARWAFRASDLGFYEWDGRTVEYHRAQVRKFLGFRECTVTDAEKLAAWLAGEVCQSERRAERVREELLQRCRQGIEQPEAQARGVDPPVAGLAQPPYSRGLRQGLCDLGQAARIRDLGKAVPLLGEPDPGRMSLARDVLMPAMTISSLRAVCRAAGYAA